MRSNFNDIPIISKAILEDILNKRFNYTQKKLSDIPSPSLLLNSQKAAIKISQYIKERKKIALVGDYDVDGVCSCAIVELFFRAIEYPIKVVIPNRFKDGYGISPKLLDNIEADLIITADNGINAIEAATICQTRGIELIITDHHTPQDILPQAYTIVNPKLSDCAYPIKEICGAEVIWLVLAELKKELGSNVDMSQFLDLLAIAIIADIMPLIDINRAIVKSGLKLLLSSTRPYAKIIRDFLSKNSITSEDIAFQIAPRINSAGRIDDASIALEFFSTTSISRAYELFEKLCDFNELRKEEEHRVTLEAIKLYDNVGEVIVVASEFWHEGVVGIVASRLVEFFSKPAIVLNIENGIAKGSARSLANVNIFELIKSTQRLLLKFGGHKMAAGVSLYASNLQEFRETINKSAFSLPKDDFILNRNIIGILPSKEIDLELLELLNRFEPYGEANEKPLFMVNEAKVLKVELFGKEKNHSKIVVMQDGDFQTLELIYFKNIVSLSQNDTISCSYRVVKNEFNLKTYAQLIISKMYT